LRRDPIDDRQRQVDRDRLAGRAPAKRSLHCGGGLHDAAL
jgi:hypothetical protein